MTKHGRKNTQKKKRQGKNNQDSTIPRQAFSLQSKKVVRTNLPFKDQFQATGSLGAAPFGNFPLTNTLYQIRTSNVAVFPGLTRFADMYSGYLITGSLMKITFRNTLTAAVMCSIYPTPALITSGQATLQGGFRLPEAKTVLLGSIQGSDSMKSIVLSSNSSKLVGYDVTGSYSFVTLFGYNPGVYTGYQVIIWSSDLTTVPVVDVMIEGVMHAQGVTAKPVLI